MMEGKEKARSMENNNTSGKFLLFRNISIYYAHTYVNDMHKHTFLYIDTLDKHKTHTKKRTGIPHAARNTIAIAASEDSLALAVTKPKATNTERELSRRPSKGERSSERGGSPSSRDKGRSEGGRRRATGGPTAPRHIADASEMIQSA